MSSILGRKLFIWLGNAAKASQFNEDFINYNEESYER